MKRKLPTLNITNMKKINSKFYIYLTLAVFYTGAFQLT